MSAAATVPWGSGTRTCVLVYRMPTGESPLFTADSAAPPTGAGMAATLFLGSIAGHAGGRRSGVRVGRRGVCDDAPHPGELDLCAPVHHHWPQNSSRWRRAEIPAVNGHGTARAVAGLFAALRDGRLLSPGLLQDATHPRAADHDLVLGGQKTWGLGVIVDDVGLSASASCVRYRVTDQKPLATTGPQDDREGVRKAGPSGRFACARPGAGCAASWGVPSTLVVAAVSAFYLLINAITWQSAQSGGATGVWAATGVAVALTALMLIR
jgi:Beta-lactamase